MHKTPFVVGEVYHVYNRGVDSRDIFNDVFDVERFEESIKMFNSILPIGSIYEMTFEKTKKVRVDKPLVKIISYCLNKNHYHLLLEEIVDRGISEFMRRMGGYTWYYNNKYKRDGILFQGTFKSVHVKSNEQLLRVFSYVSLNDRVHQLGGNTAKLVRSGWKEYINPEIDGFCSKALILDQFKSVKDLKSFCEEVLADILVHRKRKKEDDTLPDVLSEHLDII